MFDVGGWNAAAQEIQCSENTKLGQKIKVLFYNKKNKRITCGQ